MRLLFGSLVLLGLAFLVGCARGLNANSSATTFTSTTSAAPSSTAAQPTSIADLSAANVVTVTAGATTSGVNIVVPSPSGSSNITSFGKLSDGFAANTGVVIRVPSTETLVAFGPGLSTNMQVIISGPDDIGVSNIRGVQAKDGTSGIAFDAVFGTSTALGARTVYFQAPNHDVTAFAGGLEVIP